MKFIKTPLLGAYVIEPEPFLDKRGFFTRIFCQKEFATIGFCGQIVQTNLSSTRQKGAIRGLHYQLPPACETKIIQCIRGKVFDIMVDIRADSPTFMQWHSVELSKNSMRMVYIPEGFAHGFQALTNNVEMLYHHSQFYSSEYSRVLRFDDPVLAIGWPLPVGVISSQDQSSPLTDTNFKGVKI